MLAVVTLPHGQITTLSGEATLSRGLSHHRMTLVARLGRALVAEHQAESSFRVQQLLMRLRVAAQPRTTTTTLCPEDFRPVGHPAVHAPNTSQREGGGPRMPSPPSVGGAGLAEVAQAVRFPGRRVHLAVRRWSERPSINRLALDCRQSSFRHVTRGSPSHSFSVFS